MTDFNVKEKAAAEEEGRTSELCQLQLCKWHAVEAVKARLVASGRYSKERRKDLIDLIWSWVQADTSEILEEQRDKLLKELDTKERDYLTGYYGPKEPQFIAAYTKTYPNLGCNSTQRSEGYHPVLKEVTHRTQPLAEAVHNLRNHCKTLVKSYEDRINKERTSIPRLLDRQAFGGLSEQLTHFGLEKTSREWEAVKEAGAKLEHGQQGGEEEARKCGKVAYLESDVALDVSCR
jgi:hypothetical protein